MLLLPLLSCFSHVRLCVTPEIQPTGSPVPGILQARTLEWVAISFSNAWKWKVKVKSLSRVQLFTTPWTAPYQAPPSMGFPRQEYWSRVPLPSRCVELSLGFLFCSIDLYFCLFASTILSWWLWLCSRAWSQAGWFLQFHSSFSRCFGYSRVLYFHTNCEIICSSSVKNTIGSLWLHWIYRLPWVVYSFSLYWFFRSTNMVYLSNLIQIFKKSKWMEDHSNGLLNLSPPGLWRKFSLGCIGLLAVILDTVLVGCVK